MHILLAFFLFLFPSLTLTSPTIPILWEIKGQHLAQPSYLFGTIHLPDPRVTKLHPKVQAAFAQSDAVFTELDLTDEAGMNLLIRSIFRSDDSTLADDIEESGIKLLDQALKTISPDLSSTTLLNMKTWMAAFTLETISSERKHPNVPALDTQLLQRAKASGKIIGGLETFEEQLRIFDYASKSIQKEMLLRNAKALIKLDKQDISLDDELIKWYLNGGVESIFDFEKRLTGETPSQALQAFVNHELIIKRNLTMVERIVIKLNEHPNKSFFFAVGAAHLLEQNSLVELLQNKGFFIKRIN